MRNKNIDLYRGLLIGLVVLGHYTEDTVHDIIFLFHMPLFFIISGCFVNEKKLIDTCYLKNKCLVLLIPYITYLSIDFTFVGKNYSLKAIVKAIWGGRALGGIYWYITCFLFSIVLFAALLNLSQGKKRIYSDKTIKCLIFAGGGISIIESHLSERISFLNSPGIPWNLDVSLLALVYLAIGFYCKNRIMYILENSEKRYDKVAAIIVVVLVVFCYFNYQSGESFYYFDMKPVYYKQLFSAITIPCAFGFVIARMIYWFEKCRILDWLSSTLAYLGQMTIPIMFMHVPLNTWKDTLGYGRIAYILIGVGGPVVFTIVFNRFSVMRKLFGLPVIKQYSIIAR